MTYPRTLNWDFNLACVLLYQEQNSSSKIDLSICPGSQDMHVQVGTSHTDLNLLHGLGPLTLDTDSV